VQFIEGERVLCTVTSAPFTCEARLGGGQHTLTAIASDTSGQTATAVHLMRLARVKPHVSLAVKRSGGRYTVRGKVVVARENACSGPITIRAGSLRKTARVGNSCSYKATLTTTKRNATFRVSYGGNAAIAPASSKPVRI
jgi:hypothetical protein